MNSTKIKSHVFKSLLLPAVGIVYLSTTAATAHVCSVKQTKTSLLKSNDYLSFDKDVTNTLNFQEVNYWHDDEPEAIVTAVQTLPVQFDITANSVIANVNNTRDVSSKQITSNVKQVTSFQTAENSGSYLQKDRTNEEKRVVNWQRVLADYISYQISKSQFTWGEANTNLFLNVEKTWNIDSSINCVEGDIVYIDDQVHNNKNHDFWFSRGISKDMRNESYHVWSIPYTYAKEIQFIYGAYNFEARYLYTLQANNDFKHTSFNIGTQNRFALNNNLSYLYDLSQLISVNNIIYPASEKDPANLVFGFNKEIVNLYNKTLSFDQDAFIKKVSTFQDYDAKRSTIEWYIQNGVINNDNKTILEQQSTCAAIISYCNSHYEQDQTYQLFNKYNFSQSIGTLKMLHTLMNNIILKLSITTYDQKQGKYIDVGYKFSADDLNNKNALVPVDLDRSLQYWFKINSMEVESDHQPNVFIAYANDEFDSEYSTEGIVKHDNYYTVEQPEYCDVQFHQEAIDVILQSKQPSDVTKEDLINKAIVFYDNSGEVHLEKPQYYHFSLTPDDIDGTIRVQAILKNCEQREEIFDCFQKFEYEKHLDVDIRNAGYIISSKMSDDMIWEILFANGWVRQVKDEYDIIDQQTDLKNGILKFRLHSKPVVNDMGILDYKLITINHFEPFYVDFDTNSNYLNKKHEKEVNASDVKKNLLSPSIGYLHTYGQDYECDIIERSEKENYIVVQIPFESGYQTQRFQFTGDENSSTLSTGSIICISILSSGVVALVLTLSIHFVRAKKVRGFNE